MAVRYFVTTHLLKRLSVERQLHEHDSVDVFFLWNLLTYLLIEQMKDFYLKIYK